MTREALEALVDFMEVNPRVGAVGPQLIYPDGRLQLSHARFPRLRDPSGGWPNWDDMDFGYRASLADFSFWRSAAAVAWHWDYSVADLRTAYNRWYRASKGAPRFFRTHPGLQGQIPMFCDKGPIVWCQDPPALILRRLARQIASSQPAIWAMERAVPFLERRAPESTLLALLYRLIVSSYTSTAAIEMD